MTVTTDVLVLGSGIAGLSFALSVAEFAEVLLVTKRRVDDAATAWAQGGIAAVLDPRDDRTAHISDTISCGAGLCHDIAVEVCVNDGPDAVRWLQEIGVEFSRRDDGSLDLGREGGHSHRRVAHAGDITGRGIEDALVEAARRHPNIRILEGHMGVDLITQTRFGKSDHCVGAYILDTGKGSVETVIARATVMATGGAGKAYLYTSNPDIATGDGIAMAYRAGAEVANMEFYQFHPTALFHPQAKNFLISEALRGEGAVLRLPTGEAFMERYHPLRDLAPRDVVARAIDHEMKRTGSEFVHLDITHKSSSFLRERFPNIHENCLRFGIDLTSEPIPVVPAAHYLVGGITVDLRGRSSVRGLWAIGECACTGLHGANRLASNSLLEGLVFARRAADKLKEHIDELRSEPYPTIMEWETGGAVASDEAVVVSHSWDELRRLMWNYVGIVRSDSRLKRAARRIALLQEEIREYYWKHFVTQDLLELRNIAIVGELIVSSALSRRESRGLHYTLDHTASLPEWLADTVAKRGVEPHLRGR